MVQVSPIHERNGSCVLEVSSRTYKKWITQVEQMAVPRLQDKDNVPKRRDLTLVLYAKVPVRPNQQSSRTLCNNHQDEKQLQKRGLKTPVKDQEKGAKRGVVYTDTRIP
jgi:hypothetical protein